MRVQIYGAGIGGSYLFMLLRDHAEVGVKEISKAVDCRCAWGIAYKQAKELYNLVGIEFDDYVLSKPKLAIANGIEMKNKNIVTFDRKKLLSDLWQEIEFKDVEADIQVDATGTSRALLPNIEMDSIYFTVQSIEKHDFDENIYAYGRRTGYAWAFPLGDKRWHIGAGDLNYERAAELVEEMRKFYGFSYSEKSCYCKAKIRMLPPSKCKPIVYKNIFGVGEAIGCVSGFGEGNAPSLECAKILADCINNSELEEYEKRVLKNFKWIEVEHEFVRDLQRNKKLSALLKLPKIALIERKRSATVNFSVTSLIRSLR
ncbi:MAG: NAD(P)/FAD-dependent oxidoreductase [Archaeoglobales archaeon]|nr:NAD(P)/FAD-dependent oxidoreductase [Archaeoglobales archaeon]